MLEVFRKKYPSAKDLPFHLIVPSLPGYGYSSGPPLDKNWAFEDAARVINKLMVGLGFGSGYVSQGGDIGSFLSRMLAVQYDECKGRPHRITRAYRKRANPSQRYTVLMPSRFPPLVFCSSFNPSELLPRPTPKGRQMGWRQ